MNKELKKRTITFVDVETTGLNPQMHEIIEIAAIRTVDLRVVETYTTKVLPVHIDDADPKALGINGYTEEKWVGAIPIGHALARVHALLEHASLGGHNPFFDLRFIEAAYHADQRRMPAMHYHIYDTVNLAWPLKHAGLVKSVSLEPLCEFLGIPLNAHRAFDDAMASLQVARKILPLYVEGWA